jgi:5-deoxy-glucuronate isomerase
MNSESNLLQKPDKTSKIYHRVTPETAQWEYLSFEARVMDLNETWEHNTRGNEMVIVLLSGDFKISSSH